MIGGALTNQLPRLCQRWVPAGQQSTGSVAVGSRLAEVELSAVAGFYFGATNKHLVAF